MFKVNISEFDQAKEKLNETSDVIEALVAEVGYANSEFLMSSFGAWASGASESSILIENDARILSMAVSRLSGQFECASGAIEGSLAPKRDAVMSSIDASPSDPNRLYFDAGASIMTDCTEADISYDHLEAKRMDALGALGGLENAGAIQGALDALGTELNSGKTVVFYLQRNFHALDDAVREFESEYAAQFNPDEFVTDLMINDASQEMEDTFNASGLGGLLCFLGNVKGHSANNPFGAYGTVGTKGLAAWLSAIGKYVEGFKDLSWIDFSDFKSLSSFMSAWGEKFRESMGLFLPGSEWRKVADLIKEGKVLEPGTQTLVGEADDLCRDIVGTGGKIKGVGRVLGWLGLGVDCANIVGDSAKAYATAEGDESDKAAAAITTGVAGAVKTVVSKGVGAACAVLGGPIGAAVGCVAGEAASWAVGAFMDWEPVKAIGKDIENGISGAIDAVCG